MAKLNDKGLNPNDLFKAFDVNEGVPENSPFASRLPSLRENLVFNVHDYAASFTGSIKSTGGFSFLAKDFATSLPPQTQSFGRISYMPNNSTSQLGILQWPGLPPETLQKLSREMIGVQIVVQQRITDIFRYAEYSDKPWRPGWVIKSTNPDEDPEDPKLLKEIQQAKQFLSNCGYGPVFEDPLERDQLLRNSFAKFLSMIVRDSLIYDGIAIWTETDERGRIRSFAPIPAKNIRLLARPDRAKVEEIRQKELNFYGDTDISDLRNTHPTIDPQNPPFAVAIDEANNVVQAFTRDELVWYTRNPRIESEVGGYGFPELEMALVLITGFNNAIQFNADLFDKNSIPKGILAIKGNFTQRQFDALGRMWDNLQRGNRTDWTLPALQLSEKGEIEVINLEPLRKEPAYYNNLVNLFMGAIAAVYCIPVHRLGYKISGTERDSRPDTPKSLQEEDDLGLPALLTHVELLVNEYLLKNRWPLLRFEFTGKSPKEDNRLYEVSLLTKTNNERRALVGDPPYEATLGRGASKLEKLAAKLMGLAPVDPSQTGVYQSLLASFAKAGAFNEELGIPLPMPAGPGGGGSDSGPSGLGKMPGANFGHKKDPHESTKHGHQSGVRRHAKDEKSPPNLRRRNESYSTPDTQSYTSTGGGAKK